MWERVAHAVKHRECRPRVVVVEQVRGRDVPDGGVLPSRDDQRRTVVGRSDGRRHFDPVWTTAVQWAVRSSLTRGELPGYFPAATP